MTGNDAFITRKNTADGARGTEITIVPDISDSKAYTVGIAKDPDFI